jgi:hypothetical protein
MYRLLNKGSSYRAGASPIPGLRIWIQAGSGFNQASGSRRAKMTDKSRKKIKKFHVSSFQVLDVLF